MKNKWNKTKEQLIAELQNLDLKHKEQEKKLKIANQQLQANKQILKKQTNELEIRLNELNCVHLISEAVRAKDTLDEILQEISVIIPTAFTYPEITGSKITFSHKVYQTENYKDSKWQLISDIIVRREIVGKLEVCYLGKTSGSTSNAFRNEEKILISNIAERIGRIIERKLAEEELKATNQQLLSTEQQLRAAIQQLEANNQQLVASNKILQHSEEKFRMLVEDSQSGIYMIDNKQLLTFVNRAFCNITGYTKNELVGMNFIHLLAEDSVAMVIENYKNRQKGKKVPSVYSFNICRKDGEIRTVEISSSVIKGSASNAITLGMLTDKTEIKRIEAKEREKDALLRTITDNMSDVVWMCDLNLNMTYISPSVKRMMGFSVEEYLKRSIEDRHPQEEIEKIKFTLQEEIKLDAKPDADKNRSRIVEYKEFNADGTLVVTSANIKFTRDQRGAVNGLIGVSRDVSKLRKAEVALIENQRQLSTLMGNLPGMAYRCKLDKDWTMEYISDGCIKLTGYQPEELIQNKKISYNDIIHPEFRNNGFTTVEEAVAEARSFEMEYKIVCKDKTEKWVWEQGCGVYSKAGELVALEGFITDITDSKKAELELIQSEEKFRSVTEHLNDLITITNKKGIVTYASSVATQLFGYPPEEIIGKHYTHFVDESYVSIATKKFTQLVSQNSMVKGLEMKLKRKDGSTFMGELDGKPYNIGEQAGTLITISDITWRKVAEEKWKKSEATYRNLVNTMPDGVYKSTDEGVFVEVNPAMVSMLGYANKEELMAIDIKTQLYFHVNDRESVKLKENLKEMGIYRMKKKDGSEIWVEDHGWLTVDKNENIIFHEGVMRDVTERKKAEKELKESAERFKALHNASFGGIAIHDKGVIVECNLGLSQISGFSKNELIGADGIALLIAQESRETVMKNIRSGYEKSYEVLGLRKNGEKYPVRLEARQVPYKGENVRVVEFRDISERKQAEEELTKLSTAVTQSPSVIAITDTKGNFEYVNPKFTELTGYTFEEAKGKNPRILKSGEQSDEMYKELWETISSGKVWRGEFHNKKKNGELFWELASVSPIFNEKGKIINYIKVAEDITEQKQAEDNFRHSIDESPLGIRIVNQVGTTIYVNKALLDIYEFSSLKEFNNTKAIERYTEQSYQEHQERKNIRQNGGDTHDYEISIRRKNGEIRHMKVWRKEVIWNKEKHFQVINQDITELKRLNTALILAKEKAEESDHLKTAFLNNMSHEIRTPLNGITGFIGLLQDSEIADEAKQEFFDIINKSSDRLITTVTDIMDISRIEAGLVNISKSEVSINEILEEQYSFFYHQAQSKGLELIYKSDLSDREARFVTDQHKLQGILTNLIKNAIKFTEQGSITFGYAIKTLREKDVVEFYIKDTGIGIPANRIEAIFNRFEQADIEDTRVYQGSGLGLAITKSYVEMLGGKIWVTSEERKGSTFYFNIPYQQESAMEDNKKESTQKEKFTPISNLSVIVAEDDEISQLFLKTILKKEVKRITFTSNGQETIKQCRENPDTDIILMDIKMPEINGYEATREIRKFNNDVIIIAQTAHGLEGDREKALGAGCDDYIAKPIKKEILFEMIWACLARKRS